MDPLPLEPGQWDRLAGLLVDLTAAAGLALTAAFAFLLGHSVLPAFAESGVLTARRLLYSVTAVAAVAMLVGLGRAIISAVGVLQNAYPRLLV